MSQFEDGAAHDIQEIVAKRRATFVHVTILDQDNQPLANGTATPESEGVHGTFWIDDPKQADVPASRAVILRQLDGSERKLRTFERCSRAKYSIHFHFEPRPNRPDESRRRGEGSFKMKWKFPGRPCFEPALSIDSTAPEARRRRAG